MKQARVFKILAAAAVILICSACAQAASGQGIVIEGAWVRAAGGALQAGGNENQSGHTTMGIETPASGDMAMAGMNSAAYLVIHNETNVADRLLRVESDIAAMIELHKSAVENEIMTMRPVDSIEIPAGEEVVLEPGGYHIMLIGLKQPLAAGQKVHLTLIFEKSGSISVEAEVRAP